MKARSKNKLRNIRGSLNRFLSILFITALGSGFLVGLLATSPDMYETADRYMDETRWYDLDIKGILGLTEEDAAAVAALPETETVQPAKTWDMILKQGDDITWTARVFAILDRDGGTVLNQPELLEGRMPEHDGECVIQCTMGRYAGTPPGIGDVLTLAEDDPDRDTLKESLTVTEWTVTGLCRSPMSISVESDATNVGSGSVTLLVYTRDTVMTFDYYTDLYVTLRGGAETNTFSDPYEALRADALPAYEALAAERGATRAEALREEAEGRISEARDRLAFPERISAHTDALAEDALLRAEQSADTGALLREQGNPELAGILESVIPAGKAEPMPLLESAREEIADAEALLADLPDDNWLIRTREDSAGFASYRSNVEKVSALSRIFPVFFFLVALLVALTTMTRLVEENRGQIGALKSLGFPDGNIWREYLFYALGASLLGCALGFSVGFRLFPSAIANAYSMLYTLPEVRTPFRWNIALPVAPVTVGGIMLATLWACRGELRLKPAELLRPVSPKPGKRILLERITPLWKRLSFSVKVTCRNLFRYKKRFIMTVIGVAGCSALLLTGFGIRNSINDIVDLQFGEIYRYELTVLMEDEDAAEDDPTLRSFLTESGYVESTLAYASENGRISFGGKSQSLPIGAPKETERLPEFIVLRERVSGKPLAPVSGGVILTEKLCEQLGIRVGDTVTLENGDGRRGQATVTGITENYLTSFAYVSPETWEALFGEKPAFTTLLCRLTEAAVDPEHVTAAAMQSPRAVYARNTQSLKDTFADSIKSIDAVVLVLILAAGILSMVVLYNLTNVNICERKKELATISVLGFYPREVEKYIFRETNTLSLLGSFLGLFVGIALHAFVVRTVEVDAVMFGRTVYPLSYVYAMGISFLFTLLVNRLMRRQIRKVDMVEAMKAND